MCNWIVLSRWCTVNFVLNSLVPTCSNNNACNRSGAHLNLCMIESCLIARAQSIWCTNDRCSIFPTDTVFSEYDAQLYLCAIEPCPIGRAQSTRCTVGWCTIVSTGSVSSRHGAQLFSCTIAPCPVGCAQSILCTVVWCTIGTIPISFWCLWLTLLLFNYLTYFSTHFQKSIDIMKYSEVKH